MLMAVIDISTDNFVYRIKDSYGEACSYIRTLEVLDKPYFVICEDNSQYNLIMEYIHNVKVNLKKQL